MDSVSVCRTVTGESVAAPFRKDIVATTSTASPKPKLVGILANTNAPSRAYASWTEKACRAVGIEYELRELGAQDGTDAMASPTDVEDAILEANQDAGVHGIMVYVSLDCGKTRWRC